jgi:type IV pilus assembly protein PilC
MAIIITIFLLVFVVPKFKSIFDSLGGTLPIPTQILLFISSLLSRYFLASAIAVVFMVMIFKKYISTEKGRYRFDKTMLRLPIFGILIRKMAIAKFSRTFSTLVKSGVPILNSLEIVGNTSGNKIIAEAIDNSREAIKQGEPIAQPLGACKVFPAMVVRMVSIGEQTGKLDLMLTKIADFYEEQVEAAVAGLTSLIEPLVIAFLGGIIGSIVVALFLPILKIVQLVGR